jgi:hypothetical protein
LFVCLFVSFPFLAFVCVDLIHLLFFSVFSLLLALYLFISYVPSSIHPVFSSSSFFSCLSSLSLYGSSFKYGRLEQERSLLSASWRTIDYQFQVEETTWSWACGVNPIQLWTRRVTISNDKSTELQEVVKQLQAATSVTYLWLIRV